MVHGLPRASFIPAYACCPGGAAGSHGRRHIPFHLENSLVDSRFDFDSCGVGFVARLSDQPSHEILKHALTALARLEHRGAVAADGKSSDGVGVTVVIPRAWLLAQTGVILPHWKLLGVGVIFLSGEDRESRIEIESALNAQGLEALLWRAVPVRPEVLGEIANSTRPAIWHLLITSDEPAGFNRRLFLARKQFERSGLPGYIATISSATMVYKALCAGRLLADFYPDLADPDFKTAIALFHQRYATNVLPSWDRAQPFRTLAHNGEINTIWGNRSNMEARAATMPLDLHPVLSAGGRTRPRLMRLQNCWRTTAGRLVRQSGCWCLQRTPGTSRRSFNTAAIVLSHGMGPRRWLSQTAGRWERFSTAMDCARAVLRWTIRVLWLPALKWAWSTWIRRALCTADVSAPGR